MFQILRPRVVPLPPVQLSLEAALHVTDADRSAVFEEAPSPSAERMIELDKELSELHAWISGARAIERRMDSYEITGLIRQQQMDI